VATRRLADVTWWLALVASEELFSGSSRAHDADREWRFEKFAKERRLITN
jgi:hypothetical protein